MKELQQLVENFLMHPSYIPLHNKVDFSLRKTKYIKSYSLFSVYSFMSINTKYVDIYYICGVYVINKSLSPLYQISRRIQSK